LVLTKCLDMARFTIRQMSIPDGVDLSTVACFPSVFCEHDIITYEKTSYKTTSTETIKC
jgi:hypothetical protein